MRHRAITQLLLAALVAGAGHSVHAQAPVEWPIHSMSRPQPPVVNPGPFTSSAPPPSDAVVLFDGRSLANWRSADDGSKPARGRLRDDYMEVVAGTGQNRGNSGVFLMGRYEVQVLDSYQNPTYPDGQAAAIYGQHPPLVNASRPPGEWQTYDIIFLRPRFDTAGKLVRPARVTVFHNGVLVQNGVTLTGPSAHRARPPYSPHADALPISLQDHGQAVRFRNIWVRAIRG
jgi:hypothetical protein